MAKILEAGDKAPKFDIPNQNGNMKKLDIRFDKDYHSKMFNRHLESASIAARTTTP